MYEDVTWDIIIGKYEIHTHQVQSIRLGYHTRNISAISTNAKDSLTTTSLLDRRKSILHHLKLSIVLAKTYQSKWGSSHVPAVGLLALCESRCRHISSRSQPAHAASKTITLQKATTMAYRLVVHLDCKVPITPAVISEQ